MHKTMRDSVYHTAWLKLLTGTILAQACLFLSYLPHKKKRTEPQHRQGTAILSAGGEGKCKVGRGEAYSFPWTRSASSLPGTKRGTFLAGIVISCPVEGLRPMRSLCGLSLNVPKPGRVRDSPLASAKVRAERKASTTLAALTCVMPALAESARVNSFFVI